MSDTYTLTLYWRWQESTPSLTLDTLINGPTRQVAMSETSASTAESLSSRLAGSFPTVVSSDGNFSRHFARVASFHWLSNEGTMGRKKVELKLIENKCRRRVTFSKRRNGLIKKAQELSVLCDAQVALLISSSIGKRYQFASTDLANIVERYDNHLEEKAPTSTGVNDKERCDKLYTNLKPPSELLQTVQRNLQSVNIEQLKMSELTRLEEQLLVLLLKTGQRKMLLMLECLKTHNDKERFLRQENENIDKEISAMKNASDADDMVAIGFDRMPSHFTYRRPQPTTLHLLK